jgi:hypothetical protein
MAGALERIRRGQLDRPETETEIVHLDYSVRGPLTVGIGSLLGTSLPLPQDCAVFVDGAACGIYLVKPARQSSPDCPEAS